jgi:hypothetical protein
MSQNFDWTLLSFQPIDCRPFRSISVYSGPFAPDFAPGFAPDWIHAAVTWILPVRPDRGLRITISTSRPRSMRPSLPGMSVRSFDMTCVTLGSLVTSAPVARNASTTISFMDVNKLTYLSTRTLRCGLSEPGFEASLAEPCGFFRHECSEAQLRP